MASHIGAPSNRRNYHKLKGAGIHTTPEQFGKDMENLFRMYSDEVVDAIVEEVEATTKEGVEMLKNTLQPEASEGGTAKPMKRRMWRRYARGWSYLERKGTNFYHTTIRNRNHYRLTHLLEYGHATRDGNRTRAFSHIEPVDVYCSNRILTNIPKIIERG